MKKQLMALFAGASILAACGGSSTPENTSTTSAPEVAETPKTAVVEIPADINELLNKHTCLTCHAAAEKIVGPAYTEVAKRKYSNEEIVELIYKPKPEHWPDYVPMAPLPNVPKEDALKIAAWINSLATN